MYGDTNLGATDEAVILFLKTPMKKSVLDALKRHVYPEFAAHFGATAPVEETTTESPANTESVPEPPVNPTTSRGKKSATK